MPENKQVNVIAFVLFCSVGSVALSESARHAVWVRIRSPEYTVISLSSSSVALNESARPAVGT